MTAMSPEEARLRLTKTVVTSSGTVPEKRAEIKKYLNDTMDVFEKLYELLACEEAFQMQPLHKLRHPHIFYYGHTASFFINKLVMGGYTSRINPLYEEMFAIGVDEMQWDDLSSAHYDFPSSTEVKLYRDQVRERLNEYVDNVEFTIPITWESAMWPILMGIEHERIHLETSSVLIRELPLHLVKPMDFWKPCSEVDGAAPQNELVDVAAGQTVVGRAPETGPGDSVFGWDCDYGQHKVEMAAFKTSKYLVSNGEFAEFMADGGYAKEELWTKDGWGWRCFREAVRPHFWVVPEAEEKDKKKSWAGEGLKLRTLAEEIPLPASWPCEVNQHEAKAFCSWKSKRDGVDVRLPTEAEWNLLFDRFVEKDQWEWKEAPGNVNLEKYTSSCPVDKFEQGGGLYDIVGNVWQHTETPTGPLDKAFRVHPLYDDFSMPTFDGDHVIQKGGCWLATGNEATRDARFAFRRHFYQMIGIRYVVGEAVDEYAGFYRRDPAVDQYTELHYGKMAGEGGNFPEALAEHAMKAAESEGVKINLAMDVGCRSGRTSFELARKGCGEVQGVDITARYIMPGCQMRECQQTKWELPVSGELVEKKQAQASEFELADLIHKTTFWQSDPCNLHAHLKGYDLVVVNLNLLERLSAPAVFLAALAGRMNSGAVLVVASTYDWEAYNLDGKRDLWLSGFVADKGTSSEKEVHGIDGLRNALGGDFELKDVKPGFPYTLPISTTAAVTGTCEVSVWRKKTQSN